MSRSTFLGGGAPPLPPPSPSPPPPPQKSRATFGWLGSCWRRWGRTAGGGGSPRFIRVLIFLTADVCCATKKNRYVQRATFAYHRQSISMQPVVVFHRVLKVSVSVQPKIRMSFIRWYLIQPGLTCQHFHYFPPSVDILVTLIEGIAWRLDQMLECPEPICNDGRVRYRTPISGKRVSPFPSTTVDAESSNVDKKECHTSS
jgi:hypothetical protein